MTGNVHDGGAGGSGPTGADPGAGKARIVGARATHAAMASLASVQHGVVTRRQLLEAGISVGVVDRLVAAGHLRLLHRGVYLVGPVTPPRAWEMAAVLACGGFAAVSHRSAAALWRVPTVSGRPGPGNRPAEGRVEVSVRAHRRIRRAGIRAHRSTTLQPVDVTRLDSVPATTPARTLYDLAGVLPARTLEHALAETLVRRLTDRKALEALLSRPELRRGGRRLRALLASEASPAITRSEAEEAFLALIRRAGLRPPQANAAVAGYEVDFFWRVERLVVEVDGFVFHSSRRRFESDRRRDAVLSAAGLRVIRVTRRQIEREPEGLLVRLAQALARAGPFAAWGGEPTAGLAGSLQGASGVRRE